MDAVSASISIARPAGEVFEYLADIANLPEFTDHFLLDWRLTSEESYGQGAGARFRVDAPLGSRFSRGDLTYAEVSPERILARGRYGKYGRVRQILLLELEPESEGVTRVTITYETEPAILSDKLNEALGVRGFWKRRLRSSLRRLQSVLEEGKRRGARATIAGGPRKPASAFRY